MPLATAKLASFVSYFGGTVCMLLLAFAMRDALPPMAAMAALHWDRASATARPRKTIRLDDLSGKSMPWSTALSPGTDEIFEAQPPA